MFRLILLLGHQLQTLPNKPPVTIGLSAGDDCPLSNLGSIPHTPPPAGLSPKPVDWHHPASQTISSCSDIAVMVAIYLGFVNLVPSVQRACLQPHAVLRVRLLDTICGNIVCAQMHSSLYTSRCVVPGICCNAQRLINATRRRDSMRDCSGQRFSMATRRTYCSTFPAFCGRCIPSNALNMRHSSRCGLKRS